MQSSLEMEVAEADQQVSMDLLLRRANISPFLTSSSKHQDLHLQLSPCEIPSREACTIPPLDLGNCSVEESIIKASVIKTLAPPNKQPKGANRPPKSFPRSMRKVPSSSGMTSSFFGSGVCPVCPSSCVSDFFNSFEDPLSESAFSSSPSTSRSSVVSSSRPSIPSTATPSSSSLLRNRRQLPLPEIITQSPNPEPFEMHFETRTKKKKLRKSKSESFPLEGHQSFRSSSLSLDPDPLMAPFTPCVELEDDESLPKTHSDRRWNDTVGDSSSVISPNMFGKKLLVSDSDLRQFASGVNLWLRNLTCHDQDESMDVSGQDKTMTGHACPSKAGMTLKTRARKKNREPKRTIKVLPRIPLETAMRQQQQQNSRPRVTKTKSRGHTAGRIRAGGTSTATAHDKPTDCSPPTTVLIRPQKPLCRFTKQDEIEIMYSGKLELKDSKLDKALPLALICPSEIKHPKSPAQETNPSPRSPTFATAVNAMASCNCSTSLKLIKRTVNELPSMHDRVTALFQTDATPREPVLPTRRIGAYGPKERVERIKRFHEKRKQLKFTKRIKYFCRRQLAQTCPRVKGRFVSRQEYEQAVAQGKANPVAAFEAIKNTKPASSELSNQPQAQAPEIKQEPPHICNSAPSSAWASGSPPSPQVKQEEIIGNQLAPEEATREAHTEVR